MKTSSKQIRLNGFPVIEMKAGGYLAIIAPTIGSNIARLRDCKNKIEILRYNKENPIKKLKSAPVIYGLPTLYLPNRLNRGRLRVSDATYQLPVNESFFQNHIHGFLHTRNHEIVEMTAKDGKAIAKTRYVYDENDAYFTYFPVKFQADYEFILDENGMHYNFTMTNCSNKQMPYGVCNHTAFKSPFVHTGNRRDVHIKLPVERRCILNKRQLPTGELRNLSFYDEKYANGTQLATKVPINNDMYVMRMGELDGEPFYGAIITDQKSGKRICYEVDETFRFFIVWNQRGTKDYFCPEPMTWMIDAPNLDLPAEVTGYTELAPGESKTIGQHIFTK